MLIAKQVQGTWSCKSDKLSTARLREVRALLRKIKNAQIHYVGRGKNQLADVLASKALKEPIIGVVRFEEPKFQGVESLKDIINFLEIGEPPLHLTKGERQWLVRKVVGYGIIDKDIYLRGQDQVLRRVLTQENTPKILHACHDGLCGGYFAHNINCVKVLQA